MGLFLLDVVKINISGFSVSQERQNSLAQAGIKGAFAFGVRSFSTWFHRFSRLEYYTKKVTGVIFILVGLYYIWAHIIISIL